jgi:hypothetical protein
MVLTDNFTHLSLISWFTLGIHEIDQLLNWQDVVTLIGVYFQLYLLNFGTGSGSFLLTE